MSVSVAFVLAGISSNARLSIINGLILLVIGGTLTTFPDKFAKVIPRLRKILKIFLRDIHNTVITQENLEFQSLKAAYSQVIALPLKKLEFCNRFPNITQFQTQILLAKYKTTLKSPSSFSTLTQNRLLFFRSFTISAFNICLKTYSEYCLWKIGL